MFLFDVCIAQGCLLFFGLAFRGVPLPGRGVDTSNCDRHNRVAQTRRARTEQF